jgi:hypothetical protein
MKLVVKYIVSLRATADSRHYQLLITAAHAMNGRGQVIAMAAHSLKPQLVVAKLRATAMIFVAEFESALVAIAAIVTAIAVVLTVTAANFVIIFAAPFAAGELVVNSAVVDIAAIVTTTIRAVDFSINNVVAAASIALTYIKRFPLV